MALAHLPKSPEETLAKIKTLDAAHWSAPSDRLAVDIHNLEALYTEQSGKPCPAWPRR